MAKKVLGLCIIVTGTVIIELLMNVFMPVFTDTIAIAQADPNIGNFPFYEDAVAASPWWIYFMPIVIGGIAALVWLRQPEEGK